MIEQFYGVEEYSQYPDGDAMNHKKNSFNITPNTIDHYTVDKNKSDKTQRSSQQVNSFIKKELNFSSDIYVKKRTTLPVTRKKVEFNIWTILKDAIGKDLNRFTMPGNNIIL